MGTYYEVLAESEERGGADQIRYTDRRDGRPIGKWIAYQRRMYRNGELTQDRIRLLESLDGWTWNNRVHNDGKYPHARWLDRITRLKHLTKSQSLWELRSQKKWKWWLETWRRRYVLGKIEPKQKRLLESLPDGKHFFSKSYRREYASADQTKAQIQAWMSAGKKAGWYAPFQIETRAWKQETLQRILRQIFPRRFPAEIPKTLTNFRWLLNYIAWCKTPEPKRSRLLKRWAYTNGRDFDSFSEWQQELWKAAPPPSQRCKTTIEANVLRQMVMEGATNRTIARALKVSISTVAYHLHKHGIKRPKPKPLDADVLRQMTMEGATDQAIARALKVSPSTVAYHLRKHGIERPKQKTLDADVLQQMVAEGATDQAIARALKVSPSTVAYHLRKHGIERKVVAEKPNQTTARKLDADVLRQMVAEGATNRTIARALEVSPSTVAYHLRKHGIERPKPKPLDADVLRQMVAEGATNQTIAQALEVSPSTVICHLRKHGISSKTRQPPVAIHAPIRGSKPISQIISTSIPIKQTCPPSCPLRDNGCYAHPCNSKRLERIAKDGNWTADEIIAAEAKLAKEKFPDPQGLALCLHDGGGDVTTVGQAKMVAGLADWWLANRGTALWTYTHSAAWIPRAAFRRASVLGSCDTVEDIKRVVSMGYAPAVIVPALSPDGQVFQVPGTGWSLAPCPAQTLSGLTCSECRLCWADDKLRARNLGIAFRKHGRSL